ncbi:hypothetical protein BJX70DRAFT_57404 [Aspergillus crustosus]
MTIREALDNLQKEWFDRAQGKDRPVIGNHAYKLHLGHILIKDRVSVKLRAILDSQQPLIQIFPVEGHIEGIKFPPKSCIFKCGIEGDFTLQPYVQRHWLEPDFLKGAPKVFFFELVPTSKPVFIWYGSSFEDED